MKKVLTPLLFLGWVLSSQAQQTYVYKDPMEKFNEAKAYFDQGHYALAYPIFSNLNHDLTESFKASEPVTAQEISFYYTAGRLMQGMDEAALDARDYITVTRNNARTQMMSFYLAEFYFRKSQFSEAADLYEKASIANLNNRQIADMKFHQGYSYFTLQRFAQAKPLLNSIRQIKTDPNYIDANYYYGFIAFRDRNYSDALQSFRVVENEPAYESIVPYYIAQIYYVQGKKDEALDYAEKKVQQGKSQYYDLELKQLMGHAYFEKKDYAKAATYLQDFVSRSKKVRREDLYELSYSYYQTSRYPRAIEGFKQLSGKEDSLSLHAMYLLADAYLKTGDKPSARNAFLFSVSNNSNPAQKETSRFNYAKLSYELGYQDEALKSFRNFLNDYPNSEYKTEATELLVATLANTNNYRDAVVLLQQIQNPTANVKRLLPRILLGRATELINDGQLAEAQRLLDQALKDPYNGTVLPFINFWEGELAYRDNRIDEAIRYYNAYINGGAPSAGEATPRNARYNLGYTYYRKENYTVARNYFEPLAPTVALNSDPITQDAYIRTADTYFMGKDYAKAKSMYEKAVQYSWPSEDYALFQQGMIAGISNASQKITNMTTLIRRFPNSSLVNDANMEIAKSYLAAERFNEAIPYLKNIINTSGNTSMKPQAMLRLGIAYYNSNNNQAALDQFNQLLSEFPNSEEAETALNNLRVIYVEQGRPGEYVNAARRAGKNISVNVEDSLTYSAAQIKYEQGTTAVALAALTDYLSKFPEGAYAINAHYQRAELYGTSKLWDKALPDYDYVAQRAPNSFAERSVLQAARLHFFELKNYPEAERYFGQLKQITSSQENRLEAMRGLLRSQYQQGKWSEAVANSKELITLKGSSSDDKALANMAIGKAAQIGGQYDEALSSFKQVIAVNKAALAAEARYETAHTWFMTNKLSDAQKAAMETINKSGSYDFWVIKSYILIGDIFFKQKDYFNAKATFQSVVENSLNADLKTEAQNKLNQVIEEESKNSKVSSN